RIETHIHRTPVLQSRQLDKIAGTQIVFKCENFQRMGAFKMRGAMNAVLRLTDSQRAKGVVTHSSGNFAQALALAAKNVGTSAWIVMPSDAPQVKKDAVRGYGGQIIECEPNVQAREETAEHVRAQHDATFLHPFNDDDVITGQGTAGLELLQDHPDLDVLMAPVGGGGLISGCALAAHHFGINCITVGGEPTAVNDAARSMASGQIETNGTATTIADGLRTNLGDKTFPVIQDHVDRIICVDEDEIVSAMKLIWERMKIVIEPSCAVPFAALLREKDAFAGRKVGIVLSGGNVDLSRLPF
ncbi:UNVERIFIED_CONTAM: hypothetical protein GTU68_012221, partial [Idotea baltica]|nr:hypothetical protein [Idotea baltica]